jgi:deoxyribodipyrimidine photolyase-related protein
MSDRLRTIWVLGDQLNWEIGALSHADPTNDRILMVESRSMHEGRRFHRQRIHLVKTAMRRFAADLSGAGFQVDYRQAANLSEGFGQHRSSYEPHTVVATRPNSRPVQSLLESLEVVLHDSNQFLCSPSEFAEWADGRDSLRLEDFYRWQRRRLGYLMDGDQPSGGRWNFDHDNREPPPKRSPWPEPPRSRLEDLDREVLGEFRENAPGSAPVGWWATSRRAALARLNHFVKHSLPHFGTYEDAMLSTDWHMAHSLLSPYLNLGLILPDEVCDRVEEAYRSGTIPINSAEGFIRQIIGWREFVWGIYWLWPDQGQENVLGNNRDLPPSWKGDTATEMNCMSITLDGLEKRAWVHHIQRLMVLSNFANLYGIQPDIVRDWMRERYIDGADWVMGPNVMGMGLWADGGRMSTKPYVSGGAYINRMSDYCADCRFDPRKRTGEDSCPFTTLYWDFLDRHRNALEPNARMARQYANLDRLSDLADVRGRARQVIAAIEAGEI